jgi:hypothetical protein
MILRRVIAHFRKQEWTAIFLDFIIVVAGVFVGLQVNNWNEVRETRARAAVFSDRLVDDLKEEAWGYEYLIEYNKDVLTSASHAIDALSGAAPLSDERFLVAVYRATQYKYNDRRRATFDELVSTGEIGLIADENLRATAITIFTTPLIDVITKEGHDSEIRAIFRRRVPARVQHALLEFCGDRTAAPRDYSSIAGSLNYDCALGFPADEIAAAAAALRADEGLLPALQTRFADIETALTDLGPNNLRVLTSLRAFAGRAP